MKQMYRSAIDECRRSIQLDPKSVIPHLIMAQAYASSRQPEQSLEEYKIALAMNDKDPVVHARCGLALGNLGKWDQAVTQFIRATDLDPRYSEGHAGLAYALANLKRLKEALAEARIAVSWRPMIPTPTPTWLGFIPKRVITSRPQWSIVLLSRLIPKMPSGTRLLAWR